MSINHAIKLIAIDGQSGAGKGTLARRLAKSLGYRFLDSGSLYRALAFAALQHECVEDLVRVRILARHLNLEFPPEGGVIWDGQNISAEIRTEACAGIASKISPDPEVRAALHDLQRRFFTDQGLVADGRDMGTVVFPEAPFKFFLKALPEVRALRRYEELRSMGVLADKSAILAEICARDARDENRAVAPLKPASDAIILDTSYMSADQVFDLVCIKLQNFDL